MQGCIQHAEKETIRVIVERRIQHYLKELLNALRERGLDLKLPVVFTGGGAELLGYRLHSREVNTIIILDRFANGRRLQAPVGVRVCGKDDILHSIWRILVTVRLSLFFRHSHVRDAANILLIASCKRSRITAWRKRYKK